ncbi:MAG: hypothetical protein ACYTFX_06910 [Planctomycetota bacterium]
MFQKAIDILKVRWPEVVMVVVLQAAMMLLLEEVVSDSEKMDSNAALMPFWASFLLGMGTILCAVLWQMLYLGFLKTAAVFGSQPQQPLELLRSGRPYFWRIVFFQILIGIALMFLNMAIVAFLGYLIWQGRELNQLPQWFVQIGALIGILIVLKPMLLVPARMIVYDDTTFQAIFQMRYYSLKGIDRIFKVTLAGFVMIVLSTLPVAFFEQGSRAYYVLSGLHHTIFSFILLTLTLIAVLWIQQQFDAECIKTSEEESGA